MKKTVKIILTTFAVLVIIGTVFNLISGKRTLTIQTSNGEVMYRVERALTPEEQQTGLMHRPKLLPQNGMIFLFGKERLITMWMKNTLVPLDMVFFNKNGTVIYIHENAKPMDETLISSIFPTYGVLEINAGEAKKHGITVGSKLDLTQVQ